MGHYYDSSLNACPFCPQQDTQMHGFAHKTQEGLETVIQNEKTQVYSSANSSTKNDPMAGKTVIVSSASGKGNIPANTRKLMGWLVTFTNNKSGADYKLYEGRNVIGTAAGNDIVITNDSTISAKHLTILFRAGEILFEDELSTNGSFINGEMVNKGTLKDGDIIRTADTEFSFRTTFKS